MAGSKNWRAAAPEYVAAGKIEISPSPFASSWASQAAPRARFPLFPAPRHRRGLDWLTSGLPAGRSFLQTLKKERVKWA
jgi:hypothetical protein